MSFAVVIDMNPPNACYPNYFLIAYFKEPIGNTMFHVYSSMLKNTDKMSFPASTLSEYFMSLTLPSSVVGKQLQN